MTIQSRAANVPRRWLILPLSLCRARTSAWWLPVILLGVRVVVGDQPAQETLLQRGEACRCQPLSLAALAICETRDWDVEGAQILLLDHREWAGELTVMAVLHDDHASELGEHHEGRRPLRRFLVPPR